MSTVLALDHAARWGSEAAAETSRDEDEDEDEGAGMDIPGHRG